MPASFRLQAPFEPAGDQPRAIKELNAGLARGEKSQVLLGVTGSGKTMTIANVIENWGKPTLVLSHNKTLAAQLYGELKSFFPTNAVEYFISYYDYYHRSVRPVERHVLEKDASITRTRPARLRAPSSLMERRTASSSPGVGDLRSRPGVVPPSAWSRWPRDSRSRATTSCRLVGIQYNRTTSRSTRHLPRARRYRRDHPHTRSRPSGWSCGRRDRGISKIDPSPARHPSLRRRPSIRRKHFITTGRRSSAHPWRFARAARSGSMSCEARQAPGGAAARAGTGFDLEMLARSAPARHRELFAAHQRARRRRAPACLLDYFRTSSWWWSTSRT